MDAELVFPHRQGGMARRLMVEGPVAGGLGVFGPHAHRKRFADQRQVLGHEHIEGIPGGVPHRQHQRLAWDGPGGGFNAPQPPGRVPIQTGEPGVEQHLAAPGLDLAPDGADDPSQQIGAHMGFLPPGHIGGGAVFQQGFGDKAAERVPDAGGQLAVREGARAALAELDVGVGVEDAGGAELFHRPHPVVQGGAPFQHQGLIALPGQHQGAEQPGGAQAADHRPVRQGFCTPAQHQRLPGGDSNAGRGAGQGRFRTLVFECDRDGIHQHGMAAARVYRQARHLAPGGLRRADPQRAQGPGLRLRDRRGQRQADVAYIEHGFLIVM